MTTFMDSGWPVKGIRIDTTYNGETIMRMDNTSTGEADMRTDNTYTGYPCQLDRAGLLMDS